MRAIQVAAFGGPEMLSPVDLPDPVPKLGEVVVGMAAADVILLDTRCAAAGARTSSR